MAVFGRNKHRSRRIVLAAWTAFALVLGLALPAFGSVGGDASFEDNDANLSVQSTFDWNGFDPVSWSVGTAPYRQTAAQTTSGWVFNAFEDAQKTGTDTGFKGGTKQDKDCAGIIGSSAPNKDDLKRIYIAHKTVNNKVFLMLGFVRIPLNSTQSSTHIGFEFNEGKLGGCPTGSDGLVKRTPQAWGGTPTPHSGGDPTNPGDLLIVYDYEGSTTSPVITLRHWIDSGSTLTQTCEITNDAPPCWSTAVNLTTAGFAEAQVNFGANGVPGAGIVDALAPPSSGTTSVDETLGLKEFGEAGINLTDAGVFTSGVCTGFGQAEAVSRSSGNSGNAAMEDLDGPGTISITNCATVDVTKTGNDGGSQAGAVFTLTGPNNFSATCTVDAQGHCGPGTTSFTDLAPGQYTLDETTVPNGYDKDANLPVTFTLNAGDSKTLSFTDVAKPGKVNISKVDDAGDPVDGAVFTIYSPAGVDSNGVPTGNAVGSCTTGDSSGGGAGTGTCTISNVTPGTYTIDETVPTGYAKDSQFPKSITVTNGQTVTVSATNPRQFKIIVIVCRQTDNTLYPSAITIDGASAGNSLSKSQLDALGLTAPTGSTVEGKVCGITQGARGNRLAAPDASNPHSASVNIPNKQT
jgi:hypothetical protein